MSQLTTRVPVGFRFHPTDEELVGYYLPKKVNARKIDLDLIRELDLYKLEPWDLQDLCKIQAASDSNEKQTDCYFFSRKDKKYPTGNRANRATAKGFWKATGRDKPISAKLHTRLIGMRKTLVFYQGRAPHGVKTDWIMHEFRLDDGPGRPAHEDGGWVVCRVFKKNKNLKMKLQERAVSYEEQLRLLPEPLGSPEILSGGHFAFPDHDHYIGGAIKQEFINLDDDYQSHPYVNNPPGSGNTETNNTSSHSMLSSSTMVRALSFRRPGGDYLNIPEGSPSCFQADFNNNDVTTSGSDGGGDGDEAILGLEHVDWSALLQEPPKSTISGMNEFSRCPSGKSTIGSDLVLIKRQNSDIFSPMDLWNYSQVAQHM